MPYTADKKPGGLTAATVLNDGDNIVVDQSGDVKKASLTQVENKIFSSKDQKTSVDGTEVVVVRQTDNKLKQVPLNNIVRGGSGVGGLITNDMISASAAIVDTKLATINTAGKVTNQAVGAVPAILGGSYSNSVGANKIVARDGSGNFAAGTITASLSGNASTATTATTASSLAPGRTIAISGVVTGTATLFNGSTAIAIPTTITNNSIVNADINSAADIADTKLATIETPGKVANSATSATSANTHSTIVGRNASGNFVAGTITADLGGNVTGNVTGNLTGTASAIANGSVSTAKIVDASVTTEKLANITANALVPAGAVMAFARPTDPPGWLFCNSAEFSKTNSTYLALFNAIGILFGETNGSGGVGTTHFRVPDLRGIFVRGQGWQTIDWKSYSGTFAEKQSQDTQPHRHAVTDPGHTHVWSAVNGPGGQNYGVNYVAGISQFVGNTQYSVESRGTGITINDSTGTETRPANITLRYCIKF